jgi:thiol-disulfide isomerase/thioredoxin
MKRLIYLAGLVLLAACSAKKNPTIPTGNWRGTISMQGTELPFNFSVDSTESGYKASLINGDEEIKLDELLFQGDSLVMVMHIFDSELKAKIQGDSMKGYFIKNYEINYRMPFRAKQGQNFRFENPDQNIKTDFSGTYQVVFTNEAETTPAIGIFSQNGNKVKGTFLTPTGDYRYLDGNIVNNKMHLSVMDGNHLYLFIAEKISDTELKGIYRSGKAWLQDWTGKLSPDAILPDANLLTGLKPGYETFSFSFPDPDRKLITDHDEIFSNKIRIIQLLGTWCPNCMDETRFLTDWYSKNRKRGVEVIGLAFEAKDDFTYSAERVRKMKNKLQVAYPVLIAGNKDKKKASEALPMLTEVVAFPTLIFVDKNGIVKKIHTGFSGPGTGIYYERFIEEFNATVNELLLEEKVKSK